MSIFQPKFISWSKRKRGMVQRTHIKKNMKKNIFAKRKIMPKIAAKFGDKPNLPMNGILYPPK